MTTVVQTVLDNVKPIINGNWNTIVYWLIVFVGTGFLSTILASNAVKRFKGDKKKTTLCFFVILLLSASVMLCFFGCAVTVIKGVIISALFVLSSYQDIKTRECDDYIHAMIAVAALIGISVRDLPGMLIGAITVFIVLIMSLLITKAKIGGADIKFITACTFLLGISRGIVGLIIGLITAITVNLIKSKKNIKKGFPMIPYLAVGFMTAYFI